MKAAPLTWSQRYKRNVARLKSGDLAEVGLVVEELLVRRRDKGLSAGEQRMLRRAVQVIGSELDGLDLGPPSAQAVGSAHGPPPAPAKPILADIGLLLERQRYRNLTTGERHRFLQLIGHLIAAVPDDDGDGGGGPGGVREPRSPRPSQSPSMEAEAKLGGGGPADFGHGLQGGDGRR